MDANHAMRWARERLSLLFTMYTPQQRCFFGTVWVVQIMALCEAMMERSFDLRWIQHDGIHGDPPVRVRQRPAEQ